MAAHGFHQEMPPEGGYGNITYKRVPLKSPWSGRRLFSIWAGITSVSFYLYYLGARQVRKIQRENDDVHVSLEPLLLAERDRMFLRQLYKNREEEKELMKNVPGWKVGTWYGEPLYKTIGDKMIDPIIHEYYVHADPRVKEHRHYYELWL